MNTPTIYDGRCPGDLRCGAREVQLAIVLDMKIKRTNRLIAIGTSMWMVLSIGAQSPRSALPLEQRIFGAEDENLKRAIAVPEEALLFLRKDPAVQQILVSQRMSAEQLPKTWFRASEVHLSGPEEKDLVVIAIGPLRGANVTTFWIFRPTSQGLKLILSDSALGLRIKDTRSNRYQDVELASAVADRIFTSSYHFDGNEYKLFASNSVAIQR